jgi:predicted nucleic acid-binding Zn ribbon protein
MERAAKLLGQSKLAGRCFTRQQLAVAAWPAAVGKKVAAHTKAVTVAGNRLIVEVEDEVWRRQLTPLESQIVPRIAATAGTGVVASIHYRVAVPRRLPVREHNVVRSADEADQIADPILSRIYKAKRKRAIG